MEVEFVSCVPTTIKVEQMRLIKNLIDVRITDEQISKANFKDGISITVKSEKPFIVNAFWIVKIVDIHKEIEKDWLTLQDELARGKFLSDNEKSLFQNERKVFDTVREEVQCDIKPPQEIDTTKITTVTPRDFYPLAIVVTCLVQDPNPSGSEAAANIHLVHIKDSIVPVKSHVIKQYIKQIDGRILDISQLYAEDSAACFICFDEASEEENLKLFCLLPCRHSPICSNCIGRIRECPKCRCPIASVFDVNAQMAPGESSQQRCGTIDPSLSHLYDDTTDDQGSGRRKGGLFTTIKSMFGL